MNYHLVAKRGTNMVKKFQAEDRTRNRWNRAPSALIFRLRGRFPSWYFSLSYVGKLKKKLGT